MKKNIPIEKIKKTRKAKIWFERMIFFIGLTAGLASVFYSIIPFNASMIFILLEIVVATVFYIYEKPREKSDNSHIDEPFIRLSRFS